MGSASVRSTCDGSGGSCPRCSCCSSPARSTPGCGRRTRGARPAARPLALDARLPGQLALHRRRHHLHRRALRPVAAAAHLVAGDRGAVLHPVPAARARRSARCCGGGPRRCAGRIGAVAIVGRVGQRRRGWPCSGATAPIRPAATSAPTPGCTRCWSACCSASCWSAGRCGPGPPPGSSPSAALARRARAGGGRHGRATRTPRSSSTAASSLVAVATAAVIAGSERVPPLQWVLTRRPLVGLGLISYGVYLWHWPVIIVLDEAAHRPRRARARARCGSRHPRDRRWPATCSSSCPIRRGRLRTGAPPPCRWRCRPRASAPWRPSSSPPRSSPRPTVLPPRSTDVGRPPRSPRRTTSRWVS